MRTALVLLAVLLLCPSGAAGLAAHREKAAKLNEEGIRLTKDGDYPGAISAFLKARSLLPLDLTLRRNLAAARSKYGAALLAKGRIPDAVRQFRLAAALEPSVAIHHANLGVALVRNGDDDEGRKSLERALLVDPKCVPALVELGALMCRDGDSAKAVACWERALALTPGRKDIAKALTRARREARIEAGHTHQESAHFTVSWDGRKDAAVGARILTVLEDAYEAVAADLSIRPSRRVRVILYGEKEFREVTGTHDWVAGLFDGKIRIPVKNFSAAARRIRGTLFHEYTHVAVASVTRKCPAWLNEGLAQHYEGKDHRAARSRVLAAKKRDGLFSREDLQASFTRFTDPEKARLAYAESLCLTSFVLEEYGPEPVGRFLRYLGAKTKPDDAAEKAFHTSLERIFLAWEAGL